MEVLPAGGDAQRSTLTRVKLGDRLAVTANQNRAKRASALAVVGLERRDGFASWSGTENVGRIGKT